MGRSIDEHKNGCSDRWKVAQTDRKADGWKDRHINTCKTTDNATEKSPGAHFTKGTHHNHTQAEASAAGAHYRWKIKVHVEHPALLSRSSTIYLSRDKMWLHDMVLLYNVGRSPLHVYSSGCCNLQGWTGSKKKKTRCNPSFRKDTIYFWQTLAWAFFSCCSSNLHIRFGHFTSLLALTTVPWYCRCISCLSFPYQRPCYGRPTGIKGGTWRWGQP